LNKPNELLCVANVAISQDAEGRFCLNDLHKASGGDKSTRPPLWLDNLGTRRLVEEIRNRMNYKEEKRALGSQAGLQREPLLTATVKGGSGVPGTFVVEDVEVGVRHG
jgi:hypothetical protein